MTYDFNTDNRRENTNMRQMDYGNYDRGINIRGRHYDLNNSCISASDIREVSGIKPGRQIMAETGDGMMTLQEGKYYSVPPQARFKDAPAVRKACDPEADGGGRGDAPAIGNAMVVMDFDRIRSSFDRLGYEFDAAGLVGFAHSFCEGSNVVDYAYLDRNPRIPNATDRSADDLWRSGFIVREVDAELMGMYLVSNKPAAIVRDVLCSVYENKADQVVMIAPDGRLADLSVRLREKGVEVVVVDFGQTVDYDMSIKSTGFVNLEYCFGDGSEEDDGEDEPGDGDDGTDGSEGIAEGASPADVIDPAGSCSGIEGLSL